MLQGWVSVHRQIQEHWLWAEKPFSKGQAWIDMLMLANHEDRKFLLGNDLMEIKAGGFHTSEHKLAERWEWSQKKVHAFLELLEKDEMISVKRSHQGTTIFLINYANFQCGGDTQESPKNQAGVTEKSPRKTNNNDNNENNVNNSLSSRKRRGKKTEINPSFDLEALAKKLEESDDVI